MVGRCGLSPWGLTWDHQPKPHQLDHPGKKHYFLASANFKFQNISLTWTVPTICRPFRPTRSAARSKKPPLRYLSEKCSAGFSFTSFGIFFCFFVVPSNVVCKYLGVVWIVLLLGPIQAQSVGQGCLHCFFIYLLEKWKCLWRNLFVDSNVEKYGGDVEGHRLDLLERKESVDPVLD